MSIPLRQYQLEAIGAVAAAANQGRKRVVVTLPCGCGKTLTLMELCRRTIQKGNRALWLAHRDELCEQPRRTALALGVSQDAIGVVKAERDEYDRPLVIASVQTLWRRERRERVLAAGRPFPVVIYDECHHAMSASNRELLDSLPGAPHVVGITATVERADGSNLSAVFPGGICYSMNLLEAIRDGWLCDFRAERVEVPGLDLDTVGSNDEDYDDVALAEVMKVKSVIQATVGAWNSHCRERRGLIFTASIDQAILTAAELRAAGVEAVEIDGDTPIDERRAAVHGLSTGEIDCIVNCQVFTEGTDIPEVDTVVVARPTMSKSCYVQMIGRALRLAPGKAGALIIDLVGASALHTPVSAPVLVGLPTGSSGWLGARSLGENSGRVVNWTAEPPPPCWAHWVRLGDGAMAASGPDRHMAIVRDAGAGGWHADLWVDGSRTALADAPVWKELAVSLCEDVLRRLEGAKKLTKAGQAWRDKLATERQVAALAKWRVPFEVQARAAQGLMTKGEAADAMTAAIGASLLRRS